MNRFQLPYLGYGLGLRTVHYPYILEHFPREVEWFEIISENFMETDGRPRRVLEQVAAHYPIVMHGVSLSIGSTDPLNMAYLKKLKDLAAWVRPAWISDHLCFTGMNGVNTHDLLPVPYTEATLTHVVERIQRVQDFLGRRLLIENPSSYVSFAQTSMPEWEFIARMSEAADCALLLDVNNVFVSCFNHRMDTKTYLDALPLDRVVQIHLAGHRDCATHRIDTHDAPVLDEVWAMYRYVIAQTGRVSTMIEWDESIPEFPVVLAELDKARHHAANATRGNTLPSFGAWQRASDKLAQQDRVIMAQFQDDIVRPTLDAPYAYAVAQHDFTPAKQVGVYQDGYRFRLYDVIHHAYPATRAWVGDPRFAEEVMAYIEAHAPSHTTLNPYADAFPAWMAQRVDVVAGEIAVVEHALDTLFDAPESTVLTAQDVEVMGEDAWLNARIGLRSALAVCVSSHQIHDVVQHVIADSDGALPAVAQGSECVVVYRHADVMRRLRVDEVQRKALELLQSPVRVEDFLCALDETVDEVQLQAWFSLWLSNGLLAIYSD